MIDDLVFDLPHPGGLHDLLEHRSLDRPKLPVRNCLQLNNVLFDTIIIIIVTIDANHHHHHDLDARCSLTVVEDRQLSKSLPNSKPGSASCHSSVVAIFHDQDDGDDDIMTLPKTVTMNMMMKHLPKTLPSLITSYSPSAETYKWEPNSPDFHYDYHDHNDDDYNSTLSDNVRYGDDDDKDDSRMMVVAYLIFVIFFTPTHFES